MKVSVFVQVRLTSFFCILSLSIVIPTFLLVQVILLIIVIFVVSIIIYVLFVRQEYELSYIFVLIFIQDLLFFSFFPPEINTLTTAITFTHVIYNFLHQHIPCPIRLSMFKLMFLIAIRKIFYFYCKITMLIYNRKEKKYQKKIYNKYINSQQPKFFF